MADDILNINGKLIRLRDNGDGTWSWATALTGSWASTTYTTTDNWGAALTFAVPNAAGALIRIKNTHATNHALVRALCSLDGGSTYDVRILQTSTLRAGLEALVPIPAGFTHVRVEATSSTAGQPATLALQAVSKSAGGMRGRVPLINLTHNAVTVAANSWASDVDVIVAGASEVWLLIKSDKQFTVGARVFSHGQAAVVDTAMQDITAQTQTGTGWGVYLVKHKSAQGNAILAGANAIRPRYKNEDTSDPATVSIYVLAIYDL